MRYFFVQLIDAEGNDQRARAAYREGLSEMIKIPEGRTGVWSRPFEVELADQPDRVQRALVERGFYVESLPLHRR